MIPLPEALKLGTTEGVIVEIHERKQLLRQMVGNLYPRIVEDEIGQLVLRYDELGGTRLSSDLYEKIVEDRAKITNFISS